MWLGRSTPIHDRAFAANRPRWTRSVATIVQDVRCAFRGFARAPGFTLMAILIVGLGIGAATTVFTIVDRVLLRSLPYADSHRMVYFADPSHSVPDFLDWRDRTSAFDLLVAARVLDFDLTSEDRPRHVRTAIVSDGFFTLFDARPVVGTLFAQGRGTSTGRPVVVSYGLWQDTFGGDRDVVGRGITLNGQSMVITGVMSPDFPLPEVLVGRTVDAWFPFDLADTGLHHRGIFVLRAVAQLEPEETLESAQAQLNVLGNVLATEFPDQYRHEDGSIVTERIIPLQEATVSRVAGTLRMLMGAVTLMLLIACANVANLFLARGTGRQREMTLRMALGARGGRLLSQLLTETAVLAGSGGLLGVGLAACGVALFVRTNPVGVPRLAGITIDLRVLVFALATSVITGLVVGILPAFQASRSNAADVLKEGGRTSATRQGRKIRHALVVIEIATALILVTGATLLFNNMIALQRVDPGIDTDELIAVPIGLSGKTSDERAAFSRDVIERLEAVPSVTAVGAGVTIPFAITGGGRCCWFMDFARPSDGTSTEPAVVHPVTEGYFAALGASVIRGRNVTARDGSVEPVPVMLNATMARKLFGDGDPISQQLEMEGNRPVPVVVVGVVNDIRHWGLDEPVFNEVYVPFDGYGEHFHRYHLAIRTSSPIASTAPAIREAIWSIDPDLPLDEVTSMNRWVWDSIAPSRFYSALMGGFAILSLILAAAGIYGSMLYSVGQQYREIGVRLAMGARPADITRLVLQRAATITGFGLGIGLLGARLLSQTIEHLVVGVSPNDAASLATSIVVLGAISIAASYLPARKAACADPIQTLRYE
jgi:predicted permease